MKSRMCLSSSSQKMANCNYESLFICLCSENSGQVFKTFATVTWLKYCRYDLKLHPINQSINQLNCFFLRISRYVIDKINKNLLSEGFLGGNFFPLILIAIGEENWERYQLFPQIVNVMSCPYKKVVFQQKLNLLISKLFTMQSTYQSKDLLMRLELI